MIKEEIINEIKLILEELNYPDAVSYLTQNDREWLEAILKALTQEFSDNAISRQAVLEQTYNWSKDEFLRVTNPFDYLRKRINNLPPVNSQPKTECIPILDNATNGEILCSIFPDMHYTLSEKTPRVVTTIGVASSFDIDWWNSPYKRGETNE